MKSIIDICQKYCTYQIKDFIQEIDLDIDCKKVQKEMLDLIKKNNYGFNSVSLRIPKDKNTFVKSTEESFDDAYASVPHEWPQSQILHNDRNQNEYTKPHPDFAGSYTESIIPQIEKISGLKIGKIRLAWLMPNQGYPMHYDIEPIRYHIPLITNDYSYFFHDHQIYRMFPNKIYHLVTTKEHTAWNYGFLPRLHLVFSTIIDDIDFKNNIKEIHNSDYLVSRSIQSLVESESIDSKTIAILQLIDNGSHYDDINFYKKILDLYKSIT